MRDIKLPMSEADVKSLELGEMITVSGLLFTGRSRFHIRAAEDNVFPPIDYEKINCFFHVAIGFDESFFAVEHSAFGHFAESFNVLCGKGHIILPPLQILQEDSVHPVCLR